jgi:hypothetical protein
MELKPNVHTTTWKYTQHAWSTVVEDQFLISEREKKECVSHIFWSRTSS